MLPGFRFFVATIVLAASLLIFGLGAAALLRATHEEVAAMPSLRTMPPPLRPQPVDTAPPTLALLRVEIPAPPVEEMVATTETPPAPADELKSPADESAIAPSTEVTPAPEPSTAITASEGVANPAEPEATAPSAANATEPPASIVVATAPPPEAVSAPAPQPAAPAPDIASASPPAPPAEATPAPAPTTEVTERAAPVEATAPAPLPLPPTPIATGGGPVTASPAPAPEPTRVVAVTATGCEILPTAPGQPGPIPEAARTPSPPAQDNPARDDKTAKLDTEPTATIPTPVARPQLKAAATKRRLVTRHRHHAPRTRVVRREVVRPQPQPDFFTLLFGGGAQQQPAPARQ